MVREWNDGERIWQYVYSQDQLQTSSEELSVLLTEAPLNLSKNREKAAAVSFETFNVPALFMLRAGHPQPVHKMGPPMLPPCMRALPRASRYAGKVAGRDLSYVQLLPHKEGVDFHTSAESEVVRTIKE